MKLKVESLHEIKDKIFIEEIVKTWRGILSLNVLFNGY